MTFLQALVHRKEAGGIPLIPDIKCYSPKEGELMGSRDPVFFAQALEHAGACAISVVTEEQEFHGSMELLRKVCQAVSVPVLRKDFITCEQDLDETVAAGAKAILLMVSCLGEEKLEQLYHAAIDRGLTPFVETHTEQELAFAKSLKAPLIGINNRNIQVLERDDGTVQHASSLLKDAGSLESFVVVESALQNGADVRRAMQSGADAVLVGTAILKAQDPITMYHAMTRLCGLKICGLMSEADVDACAREQVDLCGFVVQYPVDVRWNLQLNEARPLLQKAREKGLKTCIVTGGDAEAVLRLAQDLRPDYVQLHYRETMDETEQMAAALLKEEIQTIRSIPLDPAARKQMFGTEDLFAIAFQLAGSSVKGILLDTREAGNASTGGGSLLSLLENHEEMGRLRKLLEENGKYLLAGGGITDANAKEVMRILKPDFLDVMTGAEDAAGQKSEERIRAIADAMRES